MINGVINVYKEKGFTSHDVVAKLRGIVHQKKIGHTGTLDPDAVGVLPVCLGKATRICEYLTNETKTYEAHLLLGQITDTQDTSGTVLEEHEVNCAREDLEEVLKSFEGDQMQVPPMYSALKVNGKKLYELAREGKEVERKARPVHFYEIRLLSCEMPRATIRVTCSKGTYIRTLCHDIGQKLGCGGCMEQLTRTRVGIFDERKAHRLADIAEYCEKGRLGDILIPVDRMFDELPSFSASQSADVLVHNGNPVPIRFLSNSLTGSFDLEQNRDMASLFATNAEADEQMSVRLYDSVGAFIGVYTLDRKNNQFRPDKIFYDPEGDG
uniref:tRNA pseudouridine(55) synthase TruB n=1 Tax=Eubacterium cellulosolvens TaxID=29322 RepID=UPI000485B534|nr:tRNA pseudouridine(55) synthase TruB [[Eubacterium] cellulosolvens]